MTQSAFKIFGGGQKMLAMFAFSRLSAPPENQKLRKPVATRWDSLFFCLERLMDLKPCSCLPTVLPTALEIMRERWLINFADTFVINVCCALMPRTFPCIPLTPDICECVISVCEGVSLACHFWNSIQAISQHSRGTGAAY